ncbi:MAG: hypothetical protein WC082_06860 [Victivallales bacterium]
MNAEITKQAIQEFKEAWTTSMNNLAKACKIYVNAIDNNPEAKKEFKKSFPSLSIQAWSRIEAVGRNQMHYLLLTDTSPAAAKLRRLPYSEQKTAIEGCVEVLAQDGTCLKVKSENLTFQMIKQVFARNCIRDVPAQKAYIESQKTVKEIKLKKPRELWSIKRNVLEVYAPSSFNRKQLLKILQEMEK